MTSTLLLAISFIGVFRGLLLFFFVIAALLLVIVILLQEGKGGGLAAAFGGAGAETFGVQTGTVNKFTSIVAGAFLGLALLYAAIRPTDESKSVLDRPAPPASVAPAEGGAPAGGSGGTPPGEGGTGGSGSDTPKGD